MKTELSRTRFLVWLGIALLTGAAVGTVVVMFTQTYPARRDVADLYVINVERNIRACELILKGDADAARRKLEDDLLITAAGIQDAFYDQPGANYFLWRIGTYFRTNQISTVSRFSNNIARIGIAYPSNTTPRIYYWQAAPSYLESVMKERRTSGEVSEVK